jgi:hypothetical protein
LKEQDSYENSTDCFFFFTIHKITSPTYAAYRILDKLLGSRERLRKSREYLMGAGAQLEYFTNTDLIDNQIVPILFDIALIEDEKYVTLKRIKSC